MLDGMRSAGLNDRNEAIEIGAGVSAGIGERMAHAGLGREMDDAIGPELDEQGLEGVVVDHVQVGEREALLSPYGGEARLLQVRVVVAVEVVQSVHRSAGAQ